MPMQYERGRVEDFGGRLGDGCALGSFARPMEPGPMRRSWDLSRPS